MYSMLAIQPFGSHDMMIFVTICLILSEIMEIVYI
jgi:hypothetical protein